MVIIVAVLFYFALLFAISRWTSRRATNTTFYRADCRSPWYMVAFGMIGASIGLHFRLCRGGLWIAPTLLPLEFDIYLWLFRTTIGTSVV